MKQAFLNRVINLGQASLKRYPEVIAIAVVGSIAAIQLIENGSKTSTNLVNLLHTCMLGVALLTGIKLMVERVSWPKHYKTLVRLSGLAFMVVYDMCLPKEITQMVVIRAVLLSLTFHCFVAVAPYLRGGEANGFWQFNKSIFLQILLSLVYTGVLYLGIALAMVAIDNLFGFRIKSERYGELWILLVGIFNTWFFLSGVPEDFEEQEQDDEYPIGLKIFTQYVLLPLVGIYFIILYAYLFKIVLQWKLPVGWVSIMILSFAIAGILSLLLVHPLRDHASDRWVKMLTTWFYRLQFPLIGLLFVAIGKRISDYGITEERYFIVVLALWLLGISVYFILGKKASIRFIPLSLGIVSLLVSFGPWGSFSVSKHNQMMRLKKEFQQVHLLKAEKVIRSNKPVNFESSKRISSIIYYLNEMHGYQCLQPLFTQNLDSLLKNKGRYEMPSLILEKVGITYIDRWKQGESTQEYVDISMNYEERKIQQVTNFQYMVDIMNFNPGEKNAAGQKELFKLEKDTLVVTYQQESAIVNLVFKGEHTKIALKALIDHYKHKSYGKSPSREELTFNVSGKRYDAKFVVISLNGYFWHEENETFLSSISAFCFLKEK